MGLSTEEVDRWSSIVRPFPLPDYLTPVGGCPMADVSDEVLLNAPPQLIAHIQRTASQGGLQVISPRQTPFSCLMTRTHGGRRELGDHVVGSIADPTAEWPTIDGANMDHLLPDEPLPTYTAEHGVRQKTRTEPITKAGRLLSDPILNCLVKGRAVIDILRRSDVSGGAETMTQALAAAWGIAVSDLEDLDAFTLGVDGPLLRHAIKADEVFPVNYAPVHVKRVVSMGVSEVTRDLLPDDSAMDWRRMRVFCEAVYILSCAIEGIPIRYFRAMPPPGDPCAPTNRSEVMVFQPAPATAWTFEAQTFSIYPKTGVICSNKMGIPREVYEALARYTAVVRPMSYAMAMGHRAVAKRTTIIEANVPPGETITEAYRMLARGVMVGSARGRTAASTVRNLIFLAIESAPFPIRLRLTRYLNLAKDECKKHLDLTEVPDSMIDRIACKFLEVGGLIRIKVVSEAAKRGASAEEWWADIIAQAPERYKMLTEGTSGWARIAMWLVFRAPTDRWAKLVKAVHYQALRDMEKGAIGAVALPPEKGSTDRLVAAARAAVRSITKAYAGYYIGVADVGLAMSDVAMEMNRPRTADMLKEAAFLWVLRARCFRGTNINPISKDEPTPSLNHFRVVAEPVDLLLKPAPYVAFDAYVTHAETSALVSPAVKAHFKEFNEPRISKAFQTLTRPIVVTKKTVLTSYLVDPPELGHAMEKAWAELTQDIREVAATYGAERCIRTLEPGSASVGPAIPVTFGLKLPQKTTNAKDYFEILTEVDDDELDWIDEIMDKMGPEFSEMVEHMTFLDANELRKLLLDAEKELSTARRPTPELVH